MRLKLLPDRISTQLIALVIVCVVILHVVFALFFFLTRLDPESVDPAETTGRLAAYVEMLSITPLHDRPARLADLAALNLPFGFSVASGRNEGICKEDKHTIPHLRRIISTAIEVVGRVDCTRQGGEAILVRLADGSFLIADLPERNYPDPAAPLAITILAVLAYGILFGTWAVLALTRPLRALAAAVSGYGLAQSLQPLVEEGPREIRTVATAFNQMRQRITALIKERGDALAAVGHDLRTPITRLRLRAEFVSDPAERERMIADLDHMDALVRSALDYLRGEARSDSRIVLDVASLLHTVADRMSDLGRNVLCDATGRALVKGDALELSRAFENLVDNACKYGGSARITLTSTPDSIIIDIIDHGPGIVAEKRLRLMEPYTRGDEARGISDGGGFGLGLTIANLVITRHDGVLSLHDAEPHGLRVNVVLPAVEAQGGSHDLPPKAPWRS